VRRWRAGGCDVVAVDLPGRAIATVSFLLRGGAAYEPTSVAGLAHLTCRLLSEGTTSRTADEFALAVEARGVNIGVHAGWNTVSANLNGPVDRLAEASALLAESFLTPRLDTDDVVRLRTERIESQEISWANPRTRAEAAFRRLMHGSTSRYSIGEGGDPSSNVRIEPDQLRVLHARWLATAGTLVVAGDLDRLDVDAISANLDAGGERIESERVRADDPPAGRRLVLIDRPRAVQSIILMGHRGPTRSTPDFAAVTTVGAVLGGTFNSRLNHQLREVRGFAYGASAGFEMGAESGDLRISTDVRTDATATALLDAVEEVRRLHADGVGADESRDAIAYQVGNFAVNLETPGAVGRSLTTMVTHGLPDDYYTQLRVELTRMGKPELDTAALTYIHPDELSIVVEADLAAVGAEVEATGLGEVSIVDTADLLANT
jgi:predicted Zn-dependent peptidase